MTGFNVNMNTGLLTLSFDEPVNHLELTPEDLTLVGSASAGATSHKVTSATRPSTSGLTLLTTLRAVDLTPVKANKALFISRATSFLNYTSSLVKDMSGNDVRFLSPVTVRTFTQDNVDPTVDKFDLLSMNAGQLRISFLEPVDATSLIPSRITIQAAQNSTSATEKVTLTGGTATDFTADRQHLEINLVQSDITRLKLLVGLATSTANSFLSVEAGAVKDIAGNDVEPVLASAGRPAQLFVEDRTNPSLTNWTLDMNTGKVTLIFDDVMKAPSLNAIHITLQGDGRGAITANTFRLRGSSTSSPDGYTITVDLSSSDTNEIKQRMGLATSLADSFISLTAQAIENQVRLAIIAILPGRAKQAAAYTPDTNSPSLSAFNLSLAAGQLTLEFNETVNISSLQPTELVLQSAANNAAEGVKRLTLTGGTASLSVTGVRFDLRLVKNDVDRLTQLIGLGTSVSDTYLAFSTRAISDVQGNPVVAVPGTAAKQADTHLRDQTKPTLQSVALDLDNGELTLTFSETIHAESVDTAKIDIRASQTMGAASRQLTGGTVSSNNSTDVIITLTTADLDALNAVRGLATGTANTFITLRAGAVTDMSGNKIDGIIEISGVQATSVEGEITSPTLTSFKFSPGVSQLEMTFSETLNASSFDPTQITLKSGAAVSASQYKLTGGTSPQTNSPVITITLSKTDIDAIKADSTLATSAANTFISITSDLVSDMSGNPVTAVLANASLALASTDYIPGHDLSHS